jgi:hypothetical protein
LVFIGLLLDQLMADGEKHFRISWRINFGDEIPPCPWRRTRERERVTNTVVYEAGRFFLETIRTSMETNLSVYSPELVPAWLVS